MNRGRIRLVIVGIACQVLLAAGGNARGAEHTLYAAEFTRMPVGCFQMGMGDAGVALALGAFSAFWNPGALSFQESYRVGVEGAQLYGGLSSQGTVAFNAPIQEGLVVGILYNSFWPHAIPEYDSLPQDYASRLSDITLRSDGTPVGYFRNNHHQLIASIGKRYAVPLPRPAGLNIPLPVDIGFGLNVKYYWQTMDPGDNMYMGMNLNLDAGMLLRLGVDYDLRKQAIARQINVAASVRNLVPSRMMWVNSPTNYTEAVDNSQYYGISYIDDEGLGKVTWKATLALHRTYAEDREDNGKARYVTSRHVGAEVTLFDMVDVRAGLSDKIAGVGAGVRYGRYSAEYLFKFDRIAFSALRLGVGVTF